MFYSVASPDWKPGQPLAPAGALLFRSRAEAASFAPEAAVVAVAVRYDSSRRSITPRRTADGAAWSAGAVGNMLGGITVFDVIPSGLVRSTVGDDLACQAAAARKVEPAPADAYAWDSLTMALLA